MHLDDEGVAQRRRGAELEEALLDATWHELTERGYGALTFDSVAQRAGTSRPVIARRWATKPDLVRAAVARVLRKDPVVAPDTGDLRADLLGLFREVNEHRIGASALITCYLGGYFLETGTNLAQLRESMLLPERPSAVDVVLERAAARGEVRLDRLSPRTRALAFDLIRHEALMRLDRVPDDELVEIVDELYLPLLRASLADPRP